jgi:metal-dependent hydrolase (beta-lactamase superfamily II)
LVGENEFDSRFEDYDFSGQLGSDWRDRSGGLSFLLELTDAKGDSRKLIFDTSDNREALMHNIKRLKADLSDVDCVVLSHGHHDYVLLSS